MMEWQKLLSTVRLGRNDLELQAARNPFQRDYDRVVFSSAFRRLHDKTQVFPMPENDHVHSRLTHSLEASCVGRSLGTIAGNALQADNCLPAPLTPRDIGDIVSAGCLAHDIGNPPFGHAGEDALATWFKRAERLRGELQPKQLADLTAFDGNAQGFRILSRLQIPRQRGGLQLTFATLGAFTKYPRESGLPERQRVGVAQKKHGFAQTEFDLFAEVAAHLGLPQSIHRVREDASEYAVYAWARHPLSFLVEAADDICNRVLDLEDGFRLGHLPFEQRDDAQGARDLLLPIAQKRPHFRLDGRESLKDQIACLRAKAIDQLIDECSAEFLRLQDVILRGAHGMPLVETIPSACELKVLETIERQRCYGARDVLEIELAGYEVLSFLSEVFVEAVLTPVDKQDKRQGRISRLVPEVPIDGSAFEKIVAVTDYLSGMTDTFATNLYRHLKGMSLPHGAR